MIPVFDPNHSRSKTLKKSDAGYNRDTTASPIESKSIGRPPLGKWVEGGWRKSGEALMAIRNEKLWKGDYNSWAEYCAKRWGYTKRHCNQLIADIATVEQVGSMLPTGASQRQATQLSAVEPEHRAEVVQAAAATAEAEERPMTARDIRKAARVIPGYQCRVADEPSTWPFGLAGSCDNQRHAQRTNAALQQGQALFSHHELASRSAQPQPGSISSLLLELPHTRPDILYVSSALSCLFQKSRPEGMIFQNVGEHPPTVCGLA